MIHDTEREKGTNSNGNLRLMDKGYTANTVVRNKGKLHLNNAYLLPALFSDSSRSFRSICSTHRELWTITTYARGRSFVSKGLWIIKNTEQEKKEHPSKLVSQSNMITFKHMA